MPDQYWKLRRIEKPRRDRVVSQACADTERVPLLLKNASVILRKKLELGADDAADPWNPDITAVKMA